MSYVPHLRQKTMSIATRAGTRSQRHSAGSLAFRPSAMLKLGKAGFKVPRYQNTYRLESTNPLDWEVIDKILQEVIETTLRDVKYNPVVCMKMCESISAEVRDRIYKKGFQRYKHVVLVSLIQKLGQSVHIQLGSLWDADRDTYSTHVFDAPEYIVVGLVVGLYYE